MTLPHDAPSAAQLTEAIREWLETKVIPESSGPLQFEARIAANVLGMIEREVSLGVDQERRHLAGLAALGCSSDADLAGKIRNGYFDSDESLRADVEAFVFESVVEKLKVANPRYLR